MKVSELKTATCAIELPRTYTRDEAIALAESWGLDMSRIEKIVPAKIGIIFIVCAGGCYGFLDYYPKREIFYHNIIKLSDIEL